MSSTNIQIKFSATTGHTETDGFYVSVTGEPIHMILVGTGTHADYIEGVRIFGAGEIAWNNTGQIHLCQQITTY